uniref:UDP-glucosyltransferase UGT73AZ1 n=1 Tax=Polygala tenuifolia TaxID=355332 RepID=A0A3G3NBC0_9FABA|nr:UDP-glucosyltransferase UGT73AZ1 [Polygala tenuifolia]
MEANGVDVSFSIPLKICFIPFVAPGHMIALVELARLFAARRLHVTVITTVKNAHLIQKYIDKDVARGIHPITIQAFTFPAQEVGLPDDGDENLVSVKDMETAIKIYKALNILQGRMEEFMSQNPPDCVVSDDIFSWTTEFAKKLGIPRLAFNTYSVFTMSLVDYVRRPDSPHLKVSSDSETFQFPGLPNTITMTRSRLPDYVRDPALSSHAIDRIFEAERNSYGVIVNCFAELETEYTEYYKKISGQTLWHVGPSALIHRNADDKGSRSHESHVDEHAFLQWLDTKEPSSVLYICFGSWCQFPDEQLYEIASGLEFSGHQFLWVVLGKDANNETEEHTIKWLPEGFEERTKNKGLILRGWAPQVLILDHPAIGGFLTHCGSNSLIEGIAAGVPFVTWPLSADQFYNEKLVTQVHGIGVEVGVEEWLPFFFEGQKYGKRVDREMVKRAVKKLMDNGEGGEEMRRRSKKLADVAKKALEKDGSSYQNLTALIKDLQRLRANRLGMSTSLYYTKQN